MGKKRHIKKIAKMIVSDTIKDLSYPSLACYFEISNGIVTIAFDKSKNYPDVFSVETKIYNILFSTDVVRLNMTQESSFKKSLTHFMSVIVSRFISDIMSASNGASAKFYMLFEKDSCAILYDDVRIVSFSKNKEDCIAKSIKMLVFGYGVYSTKYTCI